MKAVSSRTIVLTGGGTGGSVTPLLAVADDLREHGYNAVWIGTYQGLEKKLATERGLTYYAVASGKWRRYFSLRNLIDPFAVLVGFVQALVLLIKLQARLVITAGSFVSVPVIWAARVLGKKIIVHQQDIRPGLANKLMAPFADMVTVTFEKSLADYGPKAVWTGNPVRKEFVLARREPDGLSLSDELPTILVLGGGTGSEAINNLVKESLNDLTKFCRVVHISGAGHEIPSRAVSANYEPYEFLDASRLAKIMAQADLVVARAGIGTLTELSYLGKAAIIIPMPGSHQEDNARYVQERGAGITLNQENLTSEQFVRDIQLLLVELSERGTQLGATMAKLMKGQANEAMSQEIVKTIDQ